MSVAVAMTFSVGFSACLTTLPHSHCRHHRLDELYRRGRAAEAAGSNRTVGDGHPYRPLQEIGRVLLRNDLADHVAVFHFQSLAARYFEAPRVET